MSDEEEVRKVEKPDWERKGYDPPPPPKRPPPPEPEPQPDQEGE
jgi:hypothetical protein